VAGCDSVISVMGAVRFAKLTDFFPWRLFRQDAEWADRNHPYYGNYLAQKKLIELAEKHQVKRFVRLTGLGLAFSAFNPFSILFNTLLSVNNRWGLLCEQALYESKVPYVVLRPGGLADEQRCVEATNLQVDVTGKLPFPGRIGRADVAALAIAAIDLPTTAPNYTLACRWCGEGMKPKPQGFKEEGLATAKECMATVLATKAKSPPPPAMKPYGVSVGLAVTIVGSLFAKLLFVVWNLFTRIVGGYK
jgi:NAD(P)H-binding